MSGVNNKILPGYNGFLLKVAEELYGWGRFRMLLTQQTFMDCLGVFLSFWS